MQTMFQISVAGHARLLTQAPARPGRPQHANHTNPSLLPSARPPTIQRWLSPWLQWTSLDCHANATDGASATLCPAVHDFIARRHQPKSHTDGLGLGTTTALSFLLLLSSVCLRPQSGHVLCTVHSHN